LGDPRGALQSSGGFGPPLHPMKGPMTTQSLRGILATVGLQSTGRLHWRGDRADLSAFNPAFTALLGSPRQLTTGEMQAFTEFVRSLTYPPNPNENLDRTMPNPATGPSAARGQQLYTSVALDRSAVTCNLCHSQAQFGTATTGLIIPAAELQETQDIKVPQIRGLYQKLGLTRAAGEQPAARLPLRRQPHVPSRQAGRRERLVRVAHTGRGRELRVDLPRRAGRRGPAPLH
jgi:hypothetical protein